MISLQKKVKKISEGSTIGIISPSWSGPNTYPVVFDKGISNIKKYFNLNVKEFASTRAEYKNTDEYVRLRVKDIHDAFADEEVDAIFLSIGGDDSIRLLPYLDKNIILANPKIVMGFSDSTTILLYLAKLGIPSFHGPSVMAGFAEPEGLSDEFVNHFKSFFFEDWNTYEYQNYSKWTEDRSGWSDPEFLNRTKSYQENTEPKIVSGSGTREGVLLGGCIEILEMLKGTEYGISKEDWENVVFFFETSEEKPSPYYVKYALRSHGIAGAWSGAQAILIGKSKGYSEEEYKKLEDFSLSIVRDEFSNSSLGVVSNLDIGHTQPMHIYPLGCRVRIDLDNKKITLLENPFK